MKEAEELAMPEEWYKEVKEAYDVITPSGKQGRSLMEIFHSVGFTGGDAGDYVRDKNEQYFLTNRYPCMGRSFNSDDKNWVNRKSFGKPYRLSVTSVLGNTRGDIAVFDKSGGREKRQLLTHIATLNNSRHFRDIEADVAGLIACKTQSRYLRDSTIFRQVSSRTWSARTRGGSNESGASCETTISAEGTEPTASCTGASSGHQTRFEEPLRISASFTIRRDFRASGSTKSMSAETAPPTG